MFQGLKKLLEDEEQGLVGKLLVGTGVTVGGIISFELIEFAKANPLATLSVVKSFGADFVLAVILILLVNRLVGVMERSASSNQEMADAIPQIANKDERETERMQLLTQYSAQVAEEVSQGIAALMKRLDQHEQANGLMNSALDRIEKRQVAIYHHQRPEPSRPLLDPLQSVDAEQEGI